jgi:hypothetical protein
MMGVDPVDTSRTDGRRELQADRRDPYADLRRDLKLVERYIETQAPDGLNALAKDSGTIEDHRVPTGSHELVKHELVKRYGVHWSEITEKVKVRMGKTHSDPFSSGLRRCANFEGTQHHRPSRLRRPPYEKVARSREGRAHISFLARTSFLPISCSTLHG